VEVEEEAVGMHAAEACQPGLGVAAEAFAAVDVVAAHTPAAERVSRMSDAQMFLVSDGHQPVGAAPAVGVDDAVKRNPAANCLQKHIFRAVRHDLCVDLAVAFEDAEDGCFASGAASGFSLDAAWPEVALVDFDRAAQRPL